VLGSSRHGTRATSRGCFSKDRGYACECPGFNISAIKGNTLFTPSRGILVGITRNTVMEMASADGMNVETGFYTVFDFTSADEVMMTNTVAGISPVTNIDGWPIGDGKPGRKTMEWQDRYVSWLATGRHGTQVFPEAWFDLTGGAAFGAMPVPWGPDGCNGPRAMVVGGLRTSVRAGVVRRGAAGPICLHTAARRSRRDGLGSMPGHTRGGRSEPGTPATPASVSQRAGHDRPRADRCGGLGLTLTHEHILSDVGCNGPEPEAASRKHLFRRPLTMDILARCAPCPSRTATTNS